MNNPFEDVYLCYTKNKSDHKHVQWECIKFDNFLEADAYFDKNIGPDNIVECPMLSEYKKPTWVKNVSLRYKIDAMFYKKK